MITPEAHDATRPFARTQGRDTTRDRRSTIDIARWYYDRRHEVAEDALVLQQLIAAVDCTNDLAPTQWAQWYTVVLDYAPDLILELGRGLGNSTSVFGQAAWRLGRTKIISLCQSGAWQNLSAPKIAGIVDSRWFDNIDARLANILTADYGAILRDHERVLVLWDAHGLEIAEVVLGDILPRLFDRPHLVLMHDILDNRYAGMARSYGGQPLWKGAKWQQRTGAWNSRINIGWMNSIQDQVIALADFSARNDLEIGSADHEYATFFGAHPAYAAEMQQLLGDEFFSLAAQWAFLSLTGREGPFHFPAVSGRGPFAEQRPLILEQIRHLPISVVTSAERWAYASKLSWHPGSDVPPNVQVWMRCRVHVDGGAVGVGLLTPDEREFEATTVVSPAAEPQNVLLPVTDANRRGPLVIHTWDLPVSARVRIDELSLVW